MPENVWSELLRRIWQGTVSYCVINPKHVRHFNDHLVEVPHQKHGLPKIAGGMTVRDMIKE